MMLLALCLSMSMPAHSAQTDEIEVKAAYTLNFAKFTHWPQAVGADTRLQICLVGYSYVTRLLGKIAGEAFADRATRVRHVELPGNVADCNLLYIAELEPSRLRRTLATMSGLPILTVSDLPDFVFQGGMIGLVREQRRLRFEINLGAVRGAGLVLEVKLLKLAARVYDAAATEPELDLK